MRRFDYSFLKHQIPGQIVSISNVISDLNARESLRKMQNPKAFDALNSLVPISKQEIAEKVPDVSIKTVELVLGQLQKKGEIRKIGTFRNARYMKK